MTLGTRLIGRHVESSVELPRRALLVLHRFAAGGDDERVEELGVAEPRLGGERADALAILRRSRGSREGCSLAFAAARAALVVVGSGVRLASSPVA